MDPALAELLNEAAEPAQQLGQKLGELGVVVAESVLSKQVTISDALFTPTEPDELLDEFGVLPHVALEMRVSLSESEAYLVTTLLTLEDAKALFGVELTTGDQVALKALQRSAGEVADLMTLMLFTDSPVRGGIKISDERYDEIRETVGVLTDVSQGSPLVRLEYDVVEGDTRARVTHILPISLLAGLAPRLMAKPEPATEQDEPAEAPSQFDALDYGGSGGTASSSDVDVHPARFVPFDETSGQGRRKGGSGLDLILDVSLRVSVELGRTVLTVQDVLALGPGSVVELDKLAGEPVDIYVNDRLIARGEVVVVDENFGVRVTEIVATVRRQPAAV